MTEGLRQNGANSHPSDEALRRELRDGPQPGWQRNGATAVKHAGVKLEKALAEEYGGDPDRDIPEHIVLSEN